MSKGSHMATTIPVPGHVHSGTSSADRGDTEKLTDQHLINQTELAPPGAPSLQQNHSIFSFADRKVF